MLGVALRDTGLALRDLVTLAKAADDAAYDSVWAPEVGSRDAILLSGLYGSATRRVTVGTGVVPVFSRSLAGLSLSVAAAAEASGGRFLLGIGAGHRVAAESWFGATWSNPREFLRETIQVLRRVLSGERVTHEGAFRIQGFHLGSTPPAVPIYMAALTPSSLRLAGEIADGLILNWLPPEGVEKSALLAREAASDAGRRLRVVAYVRVAVVDDPVHKHTAHTAARDQTYAYLSLPAYARSLRTLGYSKDLEAMSSGGERAVDGLSRTLCAVGDAATVRGRLQAYTEAGLDSVVVYPVAFGEDPAASVLHTIRALA